MTFLRVMTLNNFNSVPEDEIECFSDVWANRAAFNVKTLKRYDPDILGLQEFEPVHGATYQQEMEGYGHAIANHQGPGTAILWKEQRFELLHHGFLTLPRGDVPHLADLEDEILLETTWVKLRCRQSGVELIYLNTHLNDASEEARRLGMARNLQQLAELDPAGGLPVIMAGDFNCNPWSPVYRTLLAEGFVDSYRAAGHGDSAESSTFHGFQGRSYFGLEWGGAVFWRVDGIRPRPGKQPTTQPVQTLSSTIVRDAEPPVYVSDHYPVVTELLIGE
jgi:endonuclease/exonuclease/phosphatase family metal-dependent hydrolase